MTTVLDELLPDWRSLSPEAKLRLARTLEGRLTPDWYDTRAPPEQMPPEWEWVTWLLMAGRGSGKTRTGAEWAWRQARAHGPNSRGALVGPTAGDTRDVLVQGESGILAVARDIRQLMPVSGSYLGAADAFAGMEVEVRVS